MDRMVLTLRRDDVTVEQQGTWDQRDTAGETRKSTAKSEFPRSEFHYSLRKVKEHQLQSRYLKPQQCTLHTMALLP